MCDSIRENWPHNYALNDKAQFSLPTNSFINKLA